MDRIAEKLKAYIDTHPLDLGEGNCETVLDQLYQAYAESHESDPPEIRCPQSLPASEFFPMSQLFA